MMCGSMISTFNVSTDNVFATWVKGTYTCSLPAV